MEIFVRYKSLFRQCVSANKKLTFLQMFPDIRIKQRTIGIVRKKVTEITVHKNKRDIKQHRDKYYFIYFHSITRIILSLQLKDIIFLWRLLIKKIRQNKPVSVTKTWEPSVSNKHIIFPQVMDDVFVYSLQIRFFYDIITVTY